MDKPKQIWNQYQLLWNEIKSHDKFNYNVFGFMIGAVGLLFSIGLSQEDPTTKILIFMAVYLFTVPTIMLILANAGRIWKISTYIRTFLEPELELIQWETRLDQIKKEDVKEGKIYWSSHMKYISALNIIASIFAICVCAIQMQANVFIKLIIIVFIGIITIMMTKYILKWEIYNMRHGVVERRYLKTWQELRSKETTQNMDMKT